MSNRPWTDSERSELIKLYPITPTHELAAKLNRTSISVFSKARKLKLCKSSEYLKSPVALALFRSAWRGKENRFKPGNQPWNKGVKGAKVCEAFDSAKYKPGNKPASWKPIGSIKSFNGYTKRKVSDTGNSKKDWVHLQVIVWEEHFGPVPPKHVVVFLDSDKSNVNIENLVCLHKAEVLWLNNNGWSKAPLEIRQSLIALAKLKCAQHIALRKLNQPRKHEN